MQKLLDIIYRFKIKKSLNLLKFLGKTYLNLFFKKFKF